MQQVMVCRDLAEERVSLPEVDSLENLHSLLAQFKNQEPRILEFEVSTGERLQIGIGGPHACAQFLNRSNMPPYLFARIRQLRVFHDTEFLLGGTPTPVAPERCLAFEDVALIAQHFFLTHCCDPSFEWQEV